MPAGRCFKKTGICDGKETMFRRTARRSATLPGWSGVLLRESLTTFATFRFSSITYLKEV
jgi:hypothetical protein